MPSLSSSLERVGMPALDAEWLHHLVGDWQLVSDLSFADLVLWVPEGGLGTWRCVTHVRPNTGRLVFYDDLVGREAEPGRARLLVRCVAERRVVAEDRAEWMDDMPLQEEAIPVVREGRCLAVMTRHTNLMTMRSPSRLELTYRSTADTIVGMIATGDFPQVGVTTDHRRGTPRVGDGVVRLDLDGIITYASPNVISSLHRFGEHGRVVGDYLSRIVTDGLEDRSVVEESLPLVLTGKAAIRAEVEGGGTNLALRSVPLSDSGERVGALVLVRDVSELRRRERELLTKDATIREIHHRVKNNLQTVAALLRLQSRRVEDDRARDALAEAERRIGTIALVHDTLSRTIDEAVDFDGIVSKAFTSIVEVTGRGESVVWEFEGSFGMVAAEDANALAMVVTELVHNAVEHGLAGVEGGIVRIRADRRRMGEEQRLTVDVEDNGTGLPEGFRPGRSGLGTRIVSALVQDLRGTIRWEARPGGGTRATFEARLRPISGAERAATL
ncbi:sensor histidine kinase [Mobilicoccus pelagius]|uniref:histidine kinase n=1 Tax=Mobilicoccus pelagius NBRC 104925 TaxID=1089455 RepID=H5URX8_9MICO|nr:sensor histidine kinase [Mobilicoccus pelagius]GAB48486.1 putative two-component histidine kinase [Mobilicoccus pelagius NBRC 104925]